MIVYRNETKSDSNTLGTVPLGEELEKKKVTAWSIKKYPEFLSRAFWVNAILGLSPYKLIVDFKGLSLNNVLEIGVWAQIPKLSVVLPSKSGIKWKTLISY